MATTTSWFFPMTIAKLNPFDHYHNHHQDHIRKTVSLDVKFGPKLRSDPNSLKIASSDFGKMVHQTPCRVLHPSSVNDIIDVINWSNDSHVPFGVAARGQGHSVRGQAMVRDGVVVEMSSLSTNHGGRPEEEVGWSRYYVDVGGGEKWIDVLTMTLKHGLAPMSWTDYLHLTVGGTLSYGGISGQTFRYGPQISNVLELDVVTGEGKLVTCSKQMNSELFYAVLGGLGQFGIITRARIVLDKAPTRVKWVRMLYHDFLTFTRDQERLISMDGLDYLEGGLIMKHSPPNNWRSSFYSEDDLVKISSSLSQHGILYSLDVVKYYDHHTASTIDQEMERLFLGLEYIPDFKFPKDKTFLEFLDRVGEGEEVLRSMDLWDVPHPWLNLFVPKSGIMEFNNGVFVDILLKQGKTAGPILVYPTTRKTWDDRMSAVIPEEETFYCVGFLHSAGEVDDWKSLDDQNNEIIEFCDKNGIQMKQYLPHYETREDWKKHFGSKWSTFRERKAQFDPNMILSPGQGIFNLMD